MVRLFLLVFVIAIVVGCNSNSQIGSRDAFGQKWQAADLEEKRNLASLNQVQDLFEGASKDEVIAAMGKATYVGMDKFGMDVITYELGPVPESEGDGQYYLTFVFENERLKNVMTNFLGASF